MHSKFGDAILSKIYFCNEHPLLDIDLEFYNFSWEGYEAALGFWWARFITDLPAKTQQHGFTKDGFVAMKNML